MTLVNMLKKECSDCKKSKPLTAFYGNNSAKDGRSNRCATCNANVVKRWEAGHRTAANAMRTKYSRSLKLRVFMKLGNRCACCGFNDSRALQLDHVNNDGAKERFPEGRSKGWARSRVAILGKALKDQDGRYQLLCANCHSIKSYETNETRIIAAKAVL